jgi:hypothetical protein
LQGRGVHGVQTPGAVGADNREPVIPEHAQVLRHSGLGDAELVLDDRANRAGGPLTVGEKFQDPAPDRVTENIERAHKTSILV